MSELFLDILNGSIAAGWLILAVLGARLVLKKAPKWLICGLWIIVAVRLLLPGTIESPVSLVPSAQTIPPQSLYDTAPVIDSGVKIVDDMVNPVYSESMRNDNLSSINPLQVWTAVGANIWFLGMCAMGLWALVSWLRIHRRLRECVPYLDNIFFCDNIDTPFIFGFFIPKIYLPSGLDEGAMTHVIAHERAHLSRRDHWWKPLGFALLAVHWFNPLMWVAYILLCRDIEMACDEKVVRSLGLDAKKAYSTALLSCAVSPRMIAACPLAFGEIGVKTRIKSVLHYRKPTFWIVVTAAVILGILAVCFLTNPMTYTPMVKYNGYYYEADGGTVSELDFQFQTDDVLISIMPDTEKIPDMNCQATNLDEEYLGCPIYHNPMDEYRRFVYVKKPSGDYLRFRIRTPNDLITQLLRDIRVLTLELNTHHTVTREDLSGDRQTGMELIFHDLEHLYFTPGRLEQTGSATIYLHPSDDYQKGIRLTQGSDGIWELYIRDKDYGPCYWLIECEAMDKHLTRYEGRAEYGNLVFSAPEYESDNQITVIRYFSRTADGVTLTAGIPVQLPEWTVTFEDLRDLEFRCFPSQGSGFMGVNYYQDAAFCSVGDRAEPFVYGNGVTGTRYYDGDVLKTVVLDTTSEVLAAFFEGTENWTEAQYREAEFILSTITLHDASGKSLLAPNAYERPVSHYTARYDFAGLDPGMTITMAEDIEITGQNVPWRVTWTQPIFEVAISLRAEDGTEYVELLHDGYGDGIFKNLPEGKYDLLIHSPIANKDRAENPSLWVTVSLDLPMEEMDLGLRMEAVDVTPSGLTLLIHQDGTPVQNLMTGTPYNIDRWENGAWVPIAYPEGTAWTTQGIMIPTSDTYRMPLSWSYMLGDLPAGHYRISKHFTAQLPNPGVVGYIPKTIEQTVYAEFTIE